ncbi:restriction endonuclease subunit S [uncultured Duncaniella sp.]|uniref:restriction endonuclease subunit S n=5 Tax=uncultured Duncaniella sp. TaxID=2768039 RepID=UPI002711D864|nr:restriction endonuclease subunit S [uncultured Duncaniella sp.]
MKLTRYKLSELIDVRRGASLAGEYYATEGELMRLTLGHFDYQGGGFKDNTSKNDLYFTGPVKPEFILSEGDIITPLTEQTPGLLGSTAMITESGKYIQSQDVALITPDESKFDRNFCYYLLPSKIVKQQLAAGAQQTKIRHTTPDRIKDLTVFIPDLASQKAIGQLLRDIDRKIALNREINRNLEAMARQLYDYWFVQFDFPDENGKPYKSSGSKMVWNEKLKREIPEGWNAALMKDFLVIGNGKDHKDLETGIYPVYGSGGLMRYVNDFLFSGESVLLPRKGSLSNFMYVNESFWTVDTMFYTKEKLKGAAKYIYYSMRYVDITRYDSGTGVPSMTSISYYAMPFVKPTNDIIKLFDEILSPWIAQIKHNEVQIKNLTKQRGELLPLLMNGQVSVMPPEVNCDLSHD